MSFKQFNLHTQIEKGIEALGYTAPTPIQLQSMPAILQGKDVMGMAQTGTGKTAAFALPILQRLMSGPRRSLRALIVAPTRELAEQIHEAIDGLGRATKLKSVTIYGGVNKNPQIRSLRQGAEIAVACPGRLLDLADQGEIDLSRIEVLVLDEADRMFDMGFLPDIRKIIKRLPTKRQTLLFSATMPEDIRKLAREVLHDPVTIRVGTGAPRIHGFPCRLSGGAASQDGPADEAPRPDGYGIGPCLHAHETPHNARGRADATGRLVGRVAAGKPLAEPAP